MEHLPSIHDSHLVSYSIDATTREIWLYTIYPAMAEICEEKTEVIFEGVIAYHFENDNFHTILFGIDEIDFLSFFNEYRQIFDKGRPYGWPGDWNTSDDAVLNYVAENQIKAFQISASSGLCGWALATSMRMIAQPTTRA
jgi:hypothetical protein